MHRGIGTKLIIFRTKASSQLIKFIYPLPFLRNLTLIISEANSCPNNEAYHY